MDEVKKEGEQTPAPASEAKKQEVKTEVVETKVETENIDYKAELEKEQKARKKAEDTIVHLKKQKKEEKQTSGEIEEPEEAPMVPVSQVEEIVKKHTFELKRELSKSQVEAELSKIDDSNLRELAKFHYENSIVPSGDVKADLENALALANKRKLNAILGEVNRAKQASDASRTSPSGGQKPQPKEKVNLNEKELRLLQRFGVKPERITELGKG